MYNKSTTPLIFLLLLVSGVAVWRGFSGEGLSAKPVDNPVDNFQKGTVIEVSGPGLKYGSYTFFSLPLTIERLCVNLYSSGWCRGHISGGENRVLESGDVVYFSREPGQLRTGKMGGSRRLLLGIKLDPNRDSREDLEAVPGIGPKTAERMVAYRREHGPFRSLGELQDFLGARVSAPDYFRVTSNPAENEGGNRK